MQKNQRMGIIAGVIGTGLFFAILVSSGLIPSYIIGFDCAKEFDKVTSNSFEIHNSENGVGAEKILSVTKSDFEQFLKNQCATNLDEWKDRSEYQYVIPQIDWKMLENVEKQFASENP